LDRFLLASVGVGVATAGMFWAILWLGAAYVYEDITAILWLEIALSSAYASWAIGKLIRSWK